MEQLWGAALGSRSSFEEQLCAAASNRSFEKPQLWGAALGTSFRTQLCGAAFGSNFAGQLSGAALENSFGEQQLWGNRFAAVLWGTALGSSCGVGSSFAEQLWGAGAALRSILATATLNSSFEERQLWGLALERNFGGQLSVATLRSSFRQPLWRIALGSRFEEQVWSRAALGQPLCRDALGKSFGKQLRGTGGSFGRLSRTTFPNNCFEEQQLWGAAWGGSFTDNFGEQPSVATLGAAFGSRFAEWLWGAVLVNRFAESQLWGNSLGA